MKQLFTRTVIAVSTLSIFAGCAFSPEKSDGVKIQRQVQNRSETAVETGLSLASTQLTPATQTLVKNSEDPWMGKRVVKRRESPPVMTYPKELQVEVNYNQGIPVELSAFVGHLTTQLRGSQSPITIKLASDLVEDSPMNQNGGVTMSSGLQSAGETGSKFTVRNYAGSLHGLLDTIASRLNISWSYNRGEVVFSKYQTKTFTISSTVGNSEVSASINGSSTGSGTTGSSSGQSIKTSYSLDIWKDIEKNVKPMLSTKGQMAISDTLGTVTITDTPDNLNRIEAYIKSTNESLTRQISVIVQVYTITQDTSDNYGIDWNAVWQQASKGLKISMAGTPTGMTNSNLSLSILDSSSSPWAASQVMFNALSTQGSVSLSQDLQLVTLNNQPVPLTNVEKIPYISKTTPGVVSNGTVTPPSVEQSEVTAGYVMNLTPRVLDIDNIMLTFSLDVTSLKSFETINIGTGTSATLIQQPRMDTRSYMHRAMVRSGQTMVLAGLQKTTQKDNKAGIGDAKNWKIGGKMESGSLRETTVVMITPVVMARSSYSVGR